MNEATIDQVISESTAVENQPIETINNEITETTEAPKEETSPEPSEPEDVPFPKKAVNALSRRDKQIGKLQAQLAAERAELARFREQSKQTHVPNMDDFENYGDYVKANAFHEFEQKQSQLQKQQEEQAKTASEQQWYQERISQITTKVHDAFKTIPDYEQLTIENRDILESLPKHVERAFYELDEPTLAFYALAKEGRLEGLASLSPERMAIELGKAEMRGASLSKARPITKAPNPIEGLKGGGNPNKTISAESSAKDLLKWVNTK